MGETALVEPYAGKSDPITIIGNGEFSQFIRMNVLQSAGFTVEEVLTSKDKDRILQLKDKIVYICSPDSTHDEYLSELVNHNHVICEKPVPSVNMVAEKYTGKYVARIDFHRRMLIERLVNALHSEDIFGYSKLRFVSHDPVPAHPDLPFVVQNSLCHECDFIYQLYNYMESPAQVAPEDWIVKINKADTAESEINLELIDPDDRYHIIIDYKKCSPDYKQSIYIDDFSYEINYQVGDGVTPFHLYVDEYIETFKEFHNAIYASGLDARGTELSNRKLFNTYLQGAELCNIIENDVSHFVNSK